jgi:hypothetical protein
MCRMASAENIALRWSAVVIMYPVYEHLAPLEPGHGWLRLSIDLRASWLSPLL